MSENPFKIIRPTDQVPDDLKKDVMGSVKFVMLLIRFVQLFMADYSASVFDSVRLTGRTDKDPRPPDRGNNTP
ncbi:MAG: hypothetical protein R2810_09070 [Flavobacteriales bacterium]|nr:hypothetical protein [Flavobacteriales bacterium]MCB0817457.1 hypothetical protein [Flavobacteriales bacterium]MCB9199289.1 hypothetical protein [Flavobacteriales bacterium]HOP43768.1 hypothetical protein [Flavobacteriales bacterium]HPF68057.1 hypothetical protein [Flavobacteriales bacterium]